MIIELACGRKLVVNNKLKIIECLCFETMSLIVAPCSLDVLETSIFALEALLLGQIFVLRTSNFPGAIILADSSSTETLYCLNRRSEHVFSLITIQCKTHLLIDSRASLDCPF